MREKADLSYDKPRKSRYQGGRALELLAAAGIAFAAAAVYLNATHYFFSQDDFTFLGRSAGLFQHPDFSAPLGARIVSTRLYFDMMHSIFGLDAGPYHWASLLLHAMNALLVYAVAKRWTGAPGVAIAAGFIFATLDLGFTAVFWISGVQDLLATFFLLASAFFWLAGAGKEPRLSFVSAGLFALSLLCKETGVLFPVALASMAWAEGVSLRRAARVLVPHSMITAAAAALFAVQSQKVPQEGAYGIGLSAGLFHNLATYIKWTADVVHPFKDRFAVIDYGAWKTALPAAAAVILILLLLRGRPARHGWAALCWYTALLAPVLPLARHTYLYYLYPAAAGAAFLAGILMGQAPGALRKRLGPRWGSFGIAFAVGVVLALGVLGARNIGSREKTRLEPDFVLPQDHVLRASVLARAADSTFFEAPVPFGASLVLINPYTPMAVDLSGDSPLEAKRKTFDMVRLALREGDVFRMRRPDLGRISFASRMENEYESDHGLLYDAYGRLTYLGTGADIWANLSTVHLLRTVLLDESVRCSRRALELAPGHPRAALNLGIALVMTGHNEEARALLTQVAETTSPAPLRAQALKWLETLESGDRPGPMPPR